MPVPGSDRAQRHLATKQHSITAAIWCYMHTSTPMELRRNTVDILQNGILSLQLVIYSNTSLPTLAIILDEFVSDFEINLIKIKECLYRCLLCAI